MDEDDEDSVNLHFFSLGSKMCDGGGEYIKLVILRVVTLILSASSFLRFCE